MAAMSDVSERSPLRSRNSAGAAGARRIDICNDPADMPRVGATAHKESAAPTEGLLKVSGEPGTQGCPAAVSTSSSPSASVAPVPACSLQDIRNDMLGASKRH